MEKELAPIGTVPLGSDDPQPANPPTPETDTPETPPAPSPAPPLKDDNPAPATPGDEGYVKWFNELTGGEFKSVDEIKSLKVGERIKGFEELNKGFSTQKQELESLKKTNEELKTQINPLSHFANEKEYIRQQLIKKYPDYDPTILTSIVLADPEKLSHIDILKMAMRVDYPDVKATDTQLNDLIEERFNISIDGYDPNEATTENLKVQMAVKDALKKFNALKADIKLPEQTDYEAKRVEQIKSLSDQWKPFVSNLDQHLDKVVIMGEENGKKVPLVEFGIDREFKNLVKSKVDDIVKSQAEAGYEFNSERQGALVNAYKQLYLINNLPKILQAHTNDVVLKMTLEQFKERHNPSQPPDPDRKPDEGKPENDFMKRVKEDIMSTRNP